MDFSTGLLAVAMVVTLAAVAWQSEDVRYMVTGRWEAGRRDE